MPMPDTIHRPNTATSEDPRPPVLTCQALTIGYAIKNKKNEVASQLNLVLREGEFVCLLGPNGAGKSTLLKTFAGIQKPLQGRVLLGSQDVSLINKTELARKLSLVLTEEIQSGNLTVYDLLTLGRYPYVGWFGLLTREDKDIIHKSVVETGIEKLIHKQLHQLSDGEKQKVMIARALAQDTSLMILDEPTAHLDLPSRVEVMKLLRGMVQKTKKTVLLSTHELDLALQVADKIWLVMPDQTMLSGTPEDLILNRSFEKAFEKNGFNFSRETGNFKVHVAVSNRKIQLKGGKVNAFWTQRALEKAGYQIDPDASWHVAVSEDEQDLHWQLQTQEGVEDLYSIEHLLAKLHVLVAAAAHPSIASC